MVTFGDVSKRHLVYGASVVVVPTCARWVGACTVLLSALLYAIARQHNTPAAFSLWASLAGCAATSMSTVASAHTLWFANGLAYIEIPLWLIPSFAIGAHWALDLFHATALREARKCTLPSHA